MVQISYIREKCIGCGYCTDVSPDFWELSSKDGKSNLIGSTLKKNTYIININDFELKNQIRVAELCPVKIIQVKKL